MPVHPFLTGAVTAAVFLTLILLLFYRIRHRLKISREMIYLLSQDQYEYLFIDIRSRDEFKAGHIPNALNVPYIECAGLLPTENMFEKIYVYGKTRRKARIVAAALDTTGYFNVAFFGAYRCWRGPVEIAEA